MGTPHDDTATLRVATYRFGDDPQGRTDRRLAEHIATQPDWRLVDTYHDQTDPTRPALSTALDDARFGLFDLLLVTGLDQLGQRLWQITGPLARLRAAGVHLITLDGQLDTSTLVGPVRLAAMAWAAEVDTQLAAADEELLGPLVVWRLAPDDARAVHGCLTTAAERWERAAAEATAGATHPPTPPQPSPGAIDATPTTRGFTTIAALARDQLLRHRRLAATLLPLID
jgi:Resolvase, N terminal domain